jgi:hypothetical protein
MTYLHQPDLTRFVLRCLQIAASRGADRSKVRVCCLSGDVRQDIHMQDRRSLYTGLGDVCHWCNWTSNRNDLDTCACRPGPGHDCAT